MRSPPMVALVSVLLTLLAVFLTFNLMPGERRIEEKLSRSYGTNDEQFRRSMGVLLGPPILEGNHVEELVNGDQIFPAMLDAIRSAKKTVTFETFIYWSETIGKEFADALSERARAGVKVHVLLDFLGSVKLDAASIEEMRAAGVEVERYHKPAWWKFTRLNNRTHRKVLVIDGKLGFTGGVGIADQWRGNAQDKDHWRDTHFRVRGPVVGQMQAVFNDNWSKSTGAVLDGEEYFPALETAGDMPAQMFSSSPTGGSESMHLMYLMTITAARREIMLSSAYFVPDELAINALAEAARRGVKIRIITPGKHIDTAIVRAASRERWGKLLESGVQMAEYRPTMFHVKCLIVDGLLVSVGSTNFDNRSFSINDEANLNVFSREFAARQAAIFEEDWKKARQITLAEWENRPVLEKMTSKFYSMFGAQL
ncbi:MAG TPA: cardiolipin synthase [Telluria sp.]